MVGKMSRDINKTLEHRKKARKEENADRRVKQAHNRTDTVLREYQAEGTMNMDNREVKQMFESAKDTLKRKAKDFPFFKHKTIGK